MLSTVLFVYFFPLNAAGDYLVNVDDEWTYATKEDGIFQEFTGIKLTSVPVSPDYPLGTIYINGTATLINQTIDEEYLVDETMITAMEANSTNKVTRNYGGISCECFYVSGDDIYFLIDAATGIVVETYAIYTRFFDEKQIIEHTWLIAWSVTEYPEDPEEPPTVGGDEVPGYDILFII